MIPLVINSHSSTIDLWDMFFDNIEKYFPEINKIYMCTDTTNYKFSDKVVQLNYDKYDNYRDQFYYCIGQVEEEFCLYMNEDYILYDRVLADQLQQIVEIVKEDQDVSFVRMMRGPEEISDRTRYQNWNYLYELDNSDQNFYSMTATIWKTRHKEKIYKLSGPMGIADKGILPMFESNAHKICKQLDMRGLVYYSGDKKRGMYHYDSTIFPHIASALVKGKWNLREYNRELFPLLSQYKIDVNKRGIY
jgi:hypothetical protein